MLNKKIFQSIVQCLSTKFIICKVNKAKLITDQHTHAVDQQSVILKIGIAKCNKILQSYFSSTVNDEALQNNDQKERFYF